MKNILITGRPRVGKTTLIKKVLGDLEVQVGGFYTQELRDEGKRVGFELVTLSGQRGVMAHVSIKGGPRVGKYGVDLRVLDDLGVKEVRRAVEDSQVVAIDEIGKMELHSSSFREAVLFALDSPKPVLATIGIGGSRFADRLRSRADVELYEVDAENRDLLYQELLDRLAEDLNPGG